VPFHESLAARLKAAPFQSWHKTAFQKFEKRPAFQ